MKDSLELRGNTALSMEQRLRREGMALCIAGMI
jgi:hypothetical protein